MKKKIDLILLLCLVFSIAIFTSCDKKNSDTMFTDDEFPIDTILCNLVVEFTLELDSIDITTLTATPSEGLEPYTYDWSNGAGINAIMVSESGSYAVTITDAEGCTVEKDTTVTISDPCELFEVEIMLDGPDSTDLRAVASGGTIPYSYLWSTGETSDVIMPLSSGIYVVTVTDTDGCTAEDSIDVSVLNPCIDFLATIYFNPDSLGGDDYLNAILSGGTTPYAFLWSTGETSGAIIVDTTGTYSVTATDADGCTAEDDYEF